MKKTIFGLVFAINCLLLTSTPVHAQDADIIPVQEDMPQTDDGTSERVIEANEEEINLMARCVMSEAGNQSDECKVAIAETIINRLLSERYPNTITEVITQNRQYSTRYNGDVTEECYDAVYAALSHKNFDADIIYFRTGHYHRFATDYRKIDDTYFST